MPGITGWVDTGFALPKSPVDLWLGQWKGAGNFLSWITEGTINSGPLGRLAYLATGYSAELPAFDISGQEQIGAAAFDAGAIALSLMAPKARISTLNGVGRVANGAKALPEFGSLAPPSRLTRPTWRQSELDLEGLYGPHGYDVQASYLNGQPVPHGAPGSTHPDVYLSGESIDIKNYNLTSSGRRSGLVRDVVAQAQTRARNLPVGDVQRIVIDVRGQNVSTATLNGVTTRIVARSSGAIARDSITFWR